MYFYIDVSQFDDKTRRFIIEPTNDDMTAYKSFPADDETNPDTQAYLAWVAEGNKPQPWNPPAE